MARRKRHHTVMRALLDGFSERGQVIARSRQGQEFPQAIRSATVVADFYSFDNEGSPDDVVEGWLASVVESDFARILPSLRRGDQPTTEMRPAIARFLATSVIRTRTARSYMAQIDHHVAGTVVLSRIAPELGWNLADMGSAEVDRLRDLCLRAWVSLPPRPDQEASNLRVIVRQSREIEQRLLKYVWSVSTTLSPALLIGDAPVLALDGHISGWHGLVPSGAAVFMPLSPQTLLVGEPHVFKRSSAADTGLVASVNVLTVREAYQYVFRHPKMTWPMDLRLDSQPPSLPKPTFSVARSDPDSSPTFPFTYPEMDDAETATLLRRLSASEVVH
jgi:Protein of unknown function (DUF4238)